MQSRLRTASACWDRNAWLASAAIATASVLIATWFNRNIAYANGALCDPWYFFGINQDYFRLRAVLGDEYQFDRFPAILPWIFLAPHLSAAALTEAKFWTYFLIASGCFSYAAVKLLGPRIGPPVSIQFLCSTFFLAPLSTDFVTAAGLAWECALLASLIQAAHSKHPSPWLALAGGLFAWSIYTHIPMVMFVFAAPLYLLLRTPKPPTRYLTNAFILLTAGFIAATFFLAGTSLFLNGNFFFFRGELLSAIRYAGSANVYPQQLQTTLQWLSDDSNAPVFLLAVGASMFTLVRLRSRCPFPERAIPAPNIAIPAVVYLAAAVLCFGWELSGRMVLEGGVVAPWLLPSAFLAIGSALSVLESPNKILSVTLCLVAACVLTWAASHLNPSIDYRWRYLLAGVALLSLLLPRRLFSLELASCCVLALLYIDYPTGYGYLPWDRMRGDGRAIYELVKRADQFIATYSGSTSPGFWVSGATTAPDDPLFVSIAAPRSFLKCNDFAASFPSLEVTRAGYDPTFPDLPTAVHNRYIVPGHRLFIIARGHELVSAGADALRSVGLSVTPLAEMELAPGIAIAAAIIH